MPLVLGNHGDVYKNIVAWMIVEMGRSLDNQMGNSRREKKTRTDVGFASLGSHPREPEDTLDQVDEAWDDVPLPEVGAVKDQQDPERDIE